MDATLDAHRNQLTELPNSLAQLRNLKGLIVNMNQLTALPDSLGQRLDDHVRDKGGRLTPSQGAAFRQLRSLLRELDANQTNEGDCLWICPVHSKMQQYDPGYPVLPGAASDEP